jgi:hypothetical protein
MTVFAASYSRSKRVREKLIPLAKNSINGQREKDVWNSRIRVFLGDLCDLSECNERAREKAYDSREDAENAKESIKIWKRIRTKNLS